MSNISEIASVANEEAIDLSSILKDLVAAGSASHGLATSELPIAAQAKVIASVAAESLATGFVLWSHRMTTEYVERFGSEELRSRFLIELKEGARLGSTALATALVDNSGAQELPITFTQTDSGYLINGHIPWASNLRPGTLVVFGAREEEGERRGLFATLVGSEGLLVKPAGELLGLNGTSSGSIRFENHQLDATQLLTHDCKGFFAAMRPRFLLLQSAFCLGLVKASLESARAVPAPSFELKISEFTARLSQIEARFRELEDSLAVFQEGGPKSGPLPFVALRLDLAVLAQEVTRVELAVVGGRGYFVAHPTSRRVRESLFLSVQAPTEGALRWELQQFS